MRHQERGAGRRARPASPPHTHTPPPPPPPSFPFNKLESRNFALAGMRAENMRIPRDRARWVFGIFRGGNHWVAADIDRNGAPIQYYDPKAAGGLGRLQGEKAAEASLEIAHIFGLSADL